MQVQQTSILPRVFLHYSSLLLEEEEGEEEREEEEVNKIEKITLIGCNSKISTPAATAQDIIIFSTLSVETPNTIINKR